MNWKDLAYLKRDLSKKIIEGLNIRIINKLDDDNSIDPVAYELCLKAKHTFKNRVSTQDNEIAMKLIEKALSIDPYFLDAKIYQVYMHYGNDNDKALAIYEEANEQALEIENIQAIMNVKRQLDLVLAKIKPDNLEKVSSYSMYRVILESYNRIQNL